MGRPGLSYETVYKAANEIVEGGGKLTLENVLAKTGGSKTTVSRLLRRFSAELEESNTAPELPPQLISSIRLAISGAEARGHAASTEKLARLDDELDQITMEAELLQAENETLGDLLARAKEELVSANGKLDQASEEIHRLQIAVQQADDKRVFAIQSLALSEAGLEQAKDFKREAESSRQAEMRAKEAAALIRGRLEALEELMSPEIAMKKQEL